MHGEVVERVLLLDGMICTANFSTPVGLWEQGRLSILRAELPATFEGAVSARLQARLGTLLIAID